MKKPEIPANEADRLRNLWEYEVLDTAPEPSFDALTSLAAHIAGAPVALISLVDANRQWFKSRHGLEVAETPRAVSICAHCVAAEAPLVIPDTSRDERFADNPLVTGEPHVRFYAGFPLRTPDGFVVGALCAIDRQPREISPRQREMLALLARQVIDQMELRRRSIKLSRYAQFFEMSVTLLCTADDTLHFRELNPAWERALGWTREELKARPLTEFIHPDDRAATLATAGRLLEGVVMTDFENRYLHKDGHWVPLSWYAAARDHMLYAAAVDLSAARQQEVLLRESEARFRAIVETAVDAVITIDGQGRITQVNPATERLFGYPPADLVGQSVTVLMPSPDRDLHDTYLASYARTGVRRMIGLGREVMATRRDGSTFPADLVVSEYQFQGQKYFTGMLRDIGDRKRLERMQSEFVATVSHELRTPLTSIRGSLGLVAGGVTGEIPRQAKEYLDIALSNSDRLVRLVNDILDIEKMQSGGMQFRQRTVDLGAAVRSAISANQSFAAAHRVRLEMAPEAPAGEVLADPDRLAQVLANLISNAVKFSPHDAAVELSVTLADNHLRVSVRDSGPGIPEEFRARIFQRFAQADSSSTRRKSGTGLGLSISKAIVERMCGRIGFESAPGGGAVFFFELPYLPPVGGADGCPGTEPRVLVCEDDPGVWQVLARLFSSEGFAVDLAPTLERARRLLARRSYDALTLDLRLADGDGGALISEIRADEDHRLTPIVVVSGSEGHLGSSAVLVADVIGKPFDEARLVAAVRNAIATCGGTHPRLLHVEDDPVVRRVLQHTMPDSWTVIGAESLQAARKALAETGFDVVVLDLGLPDGAGDELLEQVGRARVVLFSASDAPAELSRRVAAAMVKSRSRPVDVRDAILALLPRGRGMQPG